MRRLATLPLCLLALFASADDRDVATASLREIRANASAFKNTRVEFKCRLNKSERNYQPFYTSFSPESHLQVSVWGTEARIWREDGRLDFFQGLHAPREARWIGELLETPRYSWIYVWGEVVSDFDGQPWIEMTDFLVLSDKHFTDATLGAAIRAFEAFDQGDMDGALAEVAAVGPDYSLPRSDRFDVVKMRAQAAWAVGQDDLAKKSAEVALKVKPGDAALRAIQEGTAPRAMNEGEDWPVEPKGGPPATEGK
jgi:hypothetical protein